MASISIMSIFMVVKMLMAFYIIKPSYGYILFDLGCISLFIPIFFIFVKEFLDSKQELHDRVLAEVQGKNAYLEHAAKILRHDMHSGINTYIPRGISSLERRLTPEVIKTLKLESPMKLLKEGLAHTQKVYWGVYEFTNLVKQGAKLQMEEKDVTTILTNYLATTSYKDQVIIDRLPRIVINEPLFCTAIDNLIRNGLKYNDSEAKMVALTMLDDQHMAIIDNGRGMSQQDLELYSKAYARKEGQKEKGSGLGLNICIAILQEHGFAITSEKREEGGTIIRIKIK